MIALLTFCTQTRTTETDRTQAFLPACDVISLSPPLRTLESEDTDHAMPMDAKDIETLIKAKFPDAIVEIKDLAGDGDHYSATVTTSAFKGQSRVKQHKMVYEALEGRMGGVLHALQLNTTVPND